jgi:RND family efflux transporter MFP subunit
MTTILSLGLVACGLGPQEDEAPPPARVINVETAFAQAATISIPVEATGTLKPAREVLLSAEGSGRVVALEVHLGDAVRKGDVLARLDARVPRAQLAQARAQLRASEAALEWADAGFAQAESLFANKASSSSAHLQARVARDQAQAQRNGAAAAVELAETALANTWIRAPWSGTIARVQLEEGALMGPGQPAFKLVEISRLKVAVGIPGSEIARVHPGQSARVELPGLVDDIFVEGVVAHVGPEPDPISRTWPAEVLIDNDGSLHSGQLARVAVVVGERDDAVVVPDNALSGTGDPVVFVVEGDFAVERHVVLGLSLGDLVEIRSGVAAGEEVVTLGRQHLSDGSPIRRYQLGVTAADAGVTPAPDHPPVD